MLYTVERDCSNTALYEAFSVSGVDPNGAWRQRQPAGGVKKECMFTVYFSLNERMVLETLYC